MRYLPLASLSLLFLTTSLATAKDKPLMKDFIGLNGHFQFKPELYKDVCRLVRNYHNMNWDVNKPGDPITFPVCANKVNWDSQVYGKWTKQDFEVDLCAQFGGFSEANKEYRTLWTDKEAWIYKYGLEMAKFFGPSGKKKLVTSIEIGNEPGNDFDDELYQKLFIQMANGIRKGDPKMKIVTATALAGTADKYSKSLDETFSSKVIKPLYDVINLHVYAIKPKKKGQSPWDRSYPEDPSLDYLKIVDDTIKWRNLNAKDKEVWITEFGYDACTEQAMKKRDGWFKKLNWTGVTETQQAQYLIRSLLCFAERDIERAYIYFFNDEDKASIHAASGLTRNFKPKPAFWAVKHMYETLGDFRFNRLITQQANKLYAYEFINQSASQVIVIAWSPTGSGKSTVTSLRGLQGTVDNSFLMPLKQGDPEQMKFTRIGKGAIKINISESPTYITFKKKPAGGYKKKTTR